MSGYDEEATLALADAGTGKPRAYRVEIQEPDQKRRQIRVDHALFRVGSNEGNDLVLRDPAVSRIHFEIQNEGGPPRLRDLGSRNGTFVDGLRTYDAHLRDRAQIELGKTTLVFERLNEESAEPSSDVEGFGPLVGGSHAMRALYSRIERAAASDFTVLIQGESGTGKELIAQLIHDKSARREGPFVVFDCSAVPAELMESELFGHEKGAFTGASERREGCLAEADGGTLFLDEIGELPLDLQPKLLRVLESRELKPVGSSKRRQVDVRFLAATNRDLAEEVNDGTFRADLYYRLAVVQLRIPPLRERPDDIPILVRHLLARAFPKDPRRAERAYAAIPRQVLDELASRTFRGNVRELRNCVEQAVALADADGIPKFEGIDGRREAALPARASSGTADVVSQLEVRLDEPYYSQKDRIVSEFERAFLGAHLERQAGNVSRASQAAGVDRSYFRRILKKRT